MRRQTFDMTKTSGKLRHWAVNSLRPRKGVAFNMDVWLKRLSRKASKKTLNPNGPCGTAACAGGHLVYDRAFKSLGVTGMKGTVRGTVGQVRYNRVLEDWYARGSEKRVRDGAVKKSAVRARILALAEKYEARGL